MDSWHSYDSPLALGHRELEELFVGSVIAEEKIDGSQISFGLIGGELKIKSRRQNINHEAAGMFTKGVEEIKKIQNLLVPEWTYVGEYLSKLKHNTLVYDRLPKQNIVIFDIRRGHQDYLEYGEKKTEAERLGFEAAQLLYDGLVVSVAMIKELVGTTSMLGGKMMEGVVIKNYDKRGRDNKPLVAKFVSEMFKERHEKHQYGKPTKKSILEMLVDEYKTEARWNKAIQHLNEEGILQHTPKDIGPLMKEIHQDLITECEEEIKEKLYKHFKKFICQGVAAGFPEFYKERIMGDQKFSTKD